MDPFSLLGLLGPKILDLIGGAMGTDLSSPENRLEKLKIEAQLQNIMNGMPELQIQANANEAESSSVFVAGWRPAVGWICAFGALYAWILLPILQLIFSLYGYHELPAFDTVSMITVLLGMLGMGGLRTYEKQNGIARSAPLSISRKY